MAGGETGVGEGASLEHGFQTRLKIHFRHGQAHFHQTGIVHTEGAVQTVEQLGQIQLIPGIFQAGLVHQFGQSARLEIEFALLHVGPQFHVDEQGEQVGILPQQLAGDVRIVHGHGHIHVHISGKLHVGGTGHKHAVFAAAQQLQHGGDVGHAHIHGVAALHLAILLGIGAAVVQVFVHQLVGLFAAVQDGIHIIDDNGPQLVIPSHVIAQRVSHQSKGDIGAGQRGLDIRGHVGLDDGGLAVPDQRNLVFADGQRDGQVVLCGSDGFGFVVPSHIGLGKPELLKNSHKRQAGAVVPDLGDGVGKGDIRAIDFNQKVALCFRDEVRGGSDENVIFIPVKFGDSVQPCVDSECGQAQG